MGKLLEVAPQTIVAQGLTLVFGRHRGEDGVDGEGTAFVQASWHDHEVLEGTTVFFNDDGTVQSQQDHIPVPPPPEEATEGVPDPEKIGPGGSFAEASEPATPALEEATM